jgi:hypothetical protein
MPASDFGVRHEAPVPKVDSLPLYADGAMEEVDVAPLESQEFAEA